MPEMIRVSGVDLIALDNLFDFHLAFTSLRLCWHFSISLCITKKSPPPLFSLPPSLYHSVSLMLCTNERFSWLWSGPSQIDYEFRTLEWVIDYRPLSAQYTCRNMSLGAQKCWKVTKYIYASIFSSWNFIFSLYRFNYFADYNDPLKNPYIINIIIINDNWFLLSLITIRVFIPSYTSLPFKIDVINNFPTPDYWIQ